MYIIPLLLSSYSLHLIQAFTTKSLIRIHHEPYQHNPFFQPNTKSTPHPHVNLPTLYPYMIDYTQPQQSTYRSKSVVRSKSLYEITLFDEEFIEEDELLDELDEEDLKHFNDTFMTKSSGRNKFLGQLISQELRDDFVRRKPHYISDWLDGIVNWKISLPAIIFLYFSCMAPVISFGTIASQITEGSIGVLEFFLASGGAGMAYSILAGQPMAFLAPTGLTLAFISGLFRFCQIRHLPFFPIYTWVGLWTSFFMVLLGVGGSSKLIRYCTRFTDEVFNGLLSVNFIYEAYRSLKRNFLVSDPNNISMPLLSLSMALGTFISTTRLVRFEASKYLSQKIRTTIKDFGPSMVIIFFSLLNNFEWIKKFQIPTLHVPSAFELAGGRSWLIPLQSVSTDIRLLCMFPAILLTALFFMDQNISVRVVNNPERKLKKGPAYNIDMVALGLITAVLSVFGLPWMCGATVQTVNHMRSMTKNKYNPATDKIEIDSVVETRTTGFVVHAMLASTVKLLPMLAYLPIPVVSGVFLYLGRKLMTGNTFLRRIRDTFVEKKRLPVGHPVRVIGRKKVNAFTVLQICCLWTLWAFKQNPNTAMFFPGVIGLLVAIRLAILPRFFTERELVALGDPAP